MDVFGETSSYTNWYPAHNIGVQYGQISSPSLSHYEWSGLHFSSDCYMSADPYMYGTIASGGFVCES